MKTACSVGDGVQWARPSSLGDVVSLTCPPGSVISDIEWARYGQLTGTCDKPLKKMNNCEVDPELVKSRVAAMCVGYTSCALNANDANFGDTIDKPFMCPGWLPACTDTEAEDDAAAVARNEQDGNGGGHAPAARSYVYPGTEDAFLRKHYERVINRDGKIAYVKRQTTTDDEPALACTTATYPRNALIVKAICAGTR